VARQRKQLTNQFRAQSDEGTEFVIYEYTAVLDSSASKGKDSAVGGKELRTSDGQIVKWIKEGIYQVGDKPGITVYRID